MPPENIQCRIDKMFSYVKFIENQLILRKQKRLENFVNKKRAAGGI